MPRWCYSTPTNLVDSKDSRSDDAAAKTAPEEEPVMMTVRLRVAGGGFGEKDFELQASSNDEISALKAQLDNQIKQASAEYGGASMRLFYKGRELKSAQRIATAKLEPGVVVQVYLRKS